MNKEKIQIFTENLKAAIEEDMDPIHYCPLCEKPSSVITENVKFVTLVCTNPHCKMDSYTIIL